MSDDLTDKRKLFINYYLQSFNATWAYKKAYGTTNYNVAGVEGHRLLKDSRIREAIEERLAEEVLTASEVLSRLSDMAKGLNEDYLTDEGELNIAQLIEDGKAHLIKEVKQTKYGLAYVLYDAQRANELLARHYKLFTDRIEVDNELTINIVYADD